MHCILFKMRINVFYTLWIAKWNNSSNMFTVSEWQVPSSVSISFQPSLALTKTYFILSYHTWLLSDGVSNEKQTESIAKKKKKIAFSCGLDSLYSTSKQLFDLIENSITWN